jgi:hypothetical protein
MERGFYNDDFEQLIRQKADQYKMFPSDGVWKGIHRSLHTRRKWYGLGLLLFLAGISYLASLQLMAPSGPAKKIQTHAPASKLTDNAGNPSSNTNTINGPVAAASGLSGTGNNASGFTVFAPAPFNGTAATVPVVNNYPAESDLPHTIVITELPEQTIVDEIFLEKSGKNLVQSNSPVAAFPVFPSQPAEAPVAGLTLVTDAASEIGSHEIKIPPGPKTIASTQKADKIEDDKRINWLQEYAVYELTPPPMRRWAWQLAFAPTMNYRKLTSNNSVNDQINIKGLPAGAIEGKPETLVSHQPALGFGLGSYIVYSINKNFRITGGIQLNYSRYAIKAYTTPVPETGKIALDVAGSQPDSLVSLTRLRNFSGEKAEDIQNQYFQFSAPIGLEVSLLGTEKLQLNIAGTIQPTYLLNRNSYLITTDFKNYMRAPSLVRRWNVNAAAEIFVSYKTGSLKWQVGPQFRYQLLSSYVKEYPIREYLMEYGVKIGVTKTIR